MVGGDDKIYFKKFKDDCINYIDNRTKQLEYELRGSKGPVLKIMAKQLEDYSCEVYSYNSELLRKKRLTDCGIDIVNTINVILSLHTEYTDNDVGACFGKTKWTVRSAKQGHKKMDPKIPHHKVYLDNFKKIEAYFEENIKNKTHLDYEHKQC